MRKTGVLAGFYVWRAILLSSSRAYYVSYYMWKKRTHPLPGFPPQIKERFWSLCEALPEDTLPLLRTELKNRVAEIHAEAKENSNIDVQLADKIYQAGLVLITNYPKLSNKQREQVIGALRYFVAEEDSLPEQDFATGLVDDAKVVNYVIEEIGLDCFIE